MFTGIVEELGEVVTVEDAEASRRFGVRGPKATADVRQGDSVAVNGVCLTAAEITGSIFVADVMAETLDRSSLGSLGVGSRVNLERPMVLGGRLDGHLMQGHVDGTGVVSDRTPEGEVRIELEPRLARYVVEKGSIAVDGISLTVVRAAETYFTVKLIPTTLEVTTLGFRQPGDRVNLEVDVLAKYVERLLGQSVPRGSEA